MSAAVQVVDLDNYRIARLALNIHQRPGTWRTAWPTVSWFKAWLLVGRRAREVDLVGRFAAEF